MMEGVLLLFIGLPLLVLGVVLGIIGVAMFFTGIRAQASVTVWYACIVLGASVFCFGILYSFDA